MAESDAFDTSDLFEGKNLLQVATCVLALARVATELHGFALPTTTEADMQLVPQTQPVGGAATGVKVTGVRAEWEELEDSEGGQGKYYHHTPTGKVRWDPPPGW